MVDSTVAEQMLTPSPEMHYHSFLVSNVRASREFFSPAQVGLPPIESHRWHPQIDGRLLVADGGSQKNFIQGII